MNRFTGEFIVTIRSTRYSSDRFGMCERCGKHCSEVFCCQPNRVYERSSGERYLSPMGGGSYGHRECLDPTRAAIDTGTLTRASNTYLAPQQGSAA